MIASLYRMASCLCFALALMISVDQIEIVALGQTSQSSSTEPDYYCGPATTQPTWPGVKCQNHCDPNSSTPYCNTTIPVPPSTQPVTCSDCES
jgi:hypothetical protein